VNKLRSRRGLAVFALLVLLLFVFRPGVYRLRNRIAVSIGGALGRRVAIDNVRFHILPRPGFDLEGLSIYDEPEFSAEPMIHANDVFAAIRFRSLFRGRLEIASLSAANPSINLVRNESGKWNFASILERNAQIPAAPTEKRAFERRTVFPYLEASHARVNFKIGQTKKSYALVDADVSLWQDSENSWSARIKAAPVRTDFNLTDTGIITINGKWQRASSLRMTPLQFEVQWQSGQLGQITKLITGNDGGWRGAISLSARISGTPEVLTVRSETGMEAFHRYDIAGRDNIVMGTTCSAQYNALIGHFTDVLCESPIKDGYVRLSGSMAVAGRVPLISGYNLTFAASNVPVTSMLRLLRLSKKNVPPELTADGLLNAEFHLARETNVTAQRAPRSREACNGTGSITNLRLSSPPRNGIGTATSAGDEIVFAAIPLQLAGCGGAREYNAGTAGNDFDRSTEPPRRQADGRGIGLKIGPVTFAMNSSTPLRTGAWISKSGYNFFLRGDSDLSHLFGLEAMLGIPGFHPVAEGSLRIDANVSGRWQGFSAPITTGNAQLRNVHAEVRGMNVPLEIAAATVSLDPDVLIMQRISAHTGATHWNGRVTAPRHCSSAAANASAASPETRKCEYQFDLTADELSTADLATWFSPRAVKRPWYRILSPNSDSPSERAPGTDSLLALQATGNLRIGRINLKQTTATQVSTQLELDRGKLSLSSLHGRILQGFHQGNWVIDLNRSKAASGIRFRGTGTLQNVSLEQLSTIMNDAWIAGSASGTYEIKGTDLRNLMAGYEGKLQFVMRNGSFPHIEIAGAPAALPVQRFSGELAFADGACKLTGGLLESEDNTYKVSGTATSRSNLDFTLTGANDRSWIITGSLADPHTAAGVPAEVKRTEADAKVPLPQVNQK
jgi:AsmA protein